MGLPTITFNIASNGLGQSQADIQKVPGLVITGATVTGSGNVTAGMSYQIFSLPEAEAMGITQTGTNAFAWKQISDFYSVANTGAELWFMIVSAATTLEQMADITQLYAKKLLSDAGGRIRVLGLIKKSGTTETITGGLDADVHVAAIMADTLGNDFASRYQPVRIVLSGNKYSGTVADLTDYSETDLNRTAILLSNNDASKEAGIGLFLGRIASIATQRKVWRVKDGAIEPTAAYFTNSTPVDSLSTTWGAIHDKNYIFMRSFTGLPGYYFSSDVTLTKATDDFKTLSRGLVMDEAVLIAYNTLVQNLGDDVPVTASGSIQPAIVKSWQTDADNQIRTLMVNTGKLSDVKVYIDENQNIVQTGNFVVGIQLLPVGYPEYITVNIGFTTTIE
jgi:Protein of unknown function (DUF2586)